MYPQVDTAAEVIAGHPASVDVRAPVGADKIRVLGATANAAGIKYTELEPAPGPDQGEQRREVIAEVVGRRPSDVMADGHPGPE